MCALTYISTACPVTCMCVFMVDHLILVNQSIFLRIFLSCLYFCAGLNPPRSFPVHISLCIVFVLVQHMPRKSCWWDFYGYIFWHPRRYNLMVNSLIFRLLESFTPSWAMFLFLRCGSCFINLSIGSELHSSVFWLVIVFCNGLCFLQRRVSLMRGKDYTYLWV